MTSAPAARNGDEPAARPGRSETLGLVAVLAAVAAVFLPALRGSFLRWDDEGYITGNPDVAQPDLLRILDPSNLVVSDWTPATTLSFAAERALFGTSPVVPHATNVLLHLVCVVLVHRLLRTAGFRPLESLLAALVFGVHPLQVESVAWISSRKGLLAAAAGFAFLDAHLAGRRAAASAWLVLALLSKGTAVGFVAAAAAATWLGIGRAAAPRAWRWNLAWAALAAARGLVSVGAQAAAVEPLRALGLAGRMASMGPVLATQAWQFVVPAGLSAVYVHPARSWLDAEVLASWAAVAGIVTVAAVAARRDRGVAFAGCVAVACLLPTLNVVPAPFLQADRYLQGALAGLAALVVAAVRPLARLHRAAPAAVVVAWCAAALVPATVARIPAWRTDETLWRATCDTFPRMGAAWTQLGAELLAQDRPEEALACLERAVALPDNVASFSLANLALTQRRLGRVADARANAEKAVAAEPVAAAAHMALAALLGDAGDFAGAEEQFSRAFALAPRGVQAHVLRAEMWLRRGDVAAARAEAEVARALPGGSVTAVVLLAAADAIEGDIDRGFERFRAALPPGRGASEIWSGIGDRLLDAARPDVAEKAYVRAAAEDPADAILHYLVAVCRERTGDAAGAQQAAREAVARATPGAAWLPDAQRLARSP